MLSEEDVAVEPVSLAVEAAPVVHGQVEVALHAAHPERARRRRRSELQYCELLVGGSGGGPSSASAAIVANACFEN